MGRMSRYLKMLRIFLHRGGGYSRGEYLKKIHYFGSQGEHCYLQPWNFGTEPERIYIGNNVHLASNVTFINHDIAFMMFNHMDPKHKYSERYGNIHIGDNVFVGSNSTVLYDVHIGNNVIIGAGSLVNKDIPDGMIAAGVPCKVIGKFENYQKKLRKEES